MFHVGLHFWDREQPPALRIEDDRRNVMIEQHPFAGAVSTADQKHPEGIVTFDADSTPTSVTEQDFHLRRPLRMGRAAQTKAVREQTSPILPGSQVAFAKTCSPEVFCALLAMGIMRIAPEPGGQRFVLIRPRFHPHGA